MPSLCMVDISQAGLSEVAFPPTSKRVSVGFQPHQQTEHRTADQWDKQVYDVNSIVAWDLAAIVPKRGRALREASPEDFVSYADLTAQIAAQKALIEDHVDRRVQLFFQQAILCYKTPFIFEADGAEDQMGEGRALVKPKKKGKKKKVYSTQAAHSSTFPCLYAYPLDSNGRKIPHRKFVYLKYSHAYRQHNGTVELPTVVNQTDTDLDGTKGGNKLRAKAIKVLNKCAKGRYDPIRATRRFLALFEGQITALRDRTAREHKRQVAQIYLDRVREIIDETQDDAEVFDWMMGVNVETETDDEAILREIVYRRRYALIQESALIQSQIARRILAAQTAIFSPPDSDSETEEESPRPLGNLKQIHPCLRYAILKNVTKEKDRRCLTKLFCTSLNQLRSTEKSKKRLKAEYKKLEKWQKKEVKNLLRDLRAHFRALQMQEFIFRATLFKGLRVCLKDWYQREFVSAFQVLFQDEPMSRAMVSRLEQPSRVATKEEYETPENQRCKLITVEKAQMIARTFGIDAGLFLPALFTSDY